MARSDQTQMAVLGALSIRPMTGYALREEIRSTLGHFWSESFGQIYPALAELERQDLVERLGSSDSRSSSFALTPAGSARLRDLLGEPAEPSRPRNGLLLRLFFGRQIGPDACRELILEAREKAEQQLAQMDAARSGLLADTGLDRDIPYFLLTISAGEHSARATIAWADEALASLAALDEDGTVGLGTTD
ncbi:MAG TPA: PadR family transcriptional regulator [Glaciibacter sp.]|nr:PadR family transcriptional regulator [Glaciibacter sp.]